MSQFWHGHWTEDAFKPERLRNWEIPNWHPRWPDRHCTPTIFEANDRGHVLLPGRKSEASPWGNFKGTWDLPKRITRDVARKLSEPLQSQKRNWELHKMRHKKICQALDKQRGNKCAP